MCPLLLGLLGSIIGATGALAGIYLKDCLDVTKQDRIDAPRRAMLLQMLENMPEGQEWRKFETLSRVIGASREDTTRLLICIGARGSESEKDVWALTTKKPLPKDDGKIS